MKDKLDNSRGREKDELTKAYKSYDDNDFPNNETCHPRCKKCSIFCLCSTTNDECQLLNWKCVLRKCTAFTYIAIPGFERDLSNRAPMIIFNTCMTPSTCSHHDILIRENNTTYLDAKETSKNTCFLCEQLIQAKTPDFLRGILYERVKLFSVQHNIVDFYVDFYIQQIEELADHRSYYKILGNIMLLT